MKKLFRNFLLRWIFWIPLLDRKELSTEERELLERILLTRPLRKKFRKVFPKYRLPVLQILLEVEQTMPRYFRDFRIGPTDIVQATYAAAISKIEDPFYKTKEATP